MTGLIKKGQVYFVNFDPTIGAEVKKKRPAVIVSNDINNKFSPIISIAPITTNVKKVFSFEVSIPEKEGGLNKKSKIMINQARAVDKSRLIKLIGTLKKRYIDEINKALILHYDL